MTRIDKTHPDYNEAFEGPVKAGLYSHDERVTNGRLPSFDEVFFHQSLGYRRRSEYPDDRGKSTDEGAVAGTYYPVSIDEAKEVIKRLKNEGTMGKIDFVTGVLERIARTPSEHIHPIYAQRQ
jgi:hypothetical protein